VVGIHSEIGTTLEQNRHVPTEKFKAEWDRMVRGDLILRTPNEVRRNTKVALNLVFDDKATEIGAKLEEVIAGGAAEKAGLEAGDVIVSFASHKVKSADDLRTMLPSYRVGEKVKLEVDRGGHVMSVEIKLVEKSRD
jgi:S1-C subfamily serine protease